MHKISDLLQIVYFSGYWNLLVILNWVLVGLIVFIALRKKWSWKVRGTYLGLIAAYFTFGMFIPVYNAKTEQAKERTKRQTYAQEAYDYFYKKCAEDSGRFVYKPVETPQDSVYMMKPRKGATIKELRDQFWMGDPYAGALYGGNALRMEAEFLLKGGRVKKGGNLIPPVSFVEAPDFVNQERLWRYTMKPTGIMIQGAGRSASAPLIPEMRADSDPVEVIQSRYGYTWDDLSTLEDRNHWVAKSRLQIVDLKTNEVIAERIGYVFESGFGSKGYGSARTPWSDIGSGDSGWKTNYCPPRKNHTDMRWILSVLHNIHYE
ncbi:hypothetical protein FACS1894154_08300 [Betaproteobacteria bacterium]|nr:hypothetical protein FACS1894154_08300 [Betaproteobacteria bacterium]GHU25984.1 hypothetical protein FACS189488_13870 [Betaproteobacteria bacterium]GHU32451.1 hypothetical protein FACS189497_14040 [Betaproteobacteria bacterium]